MKTSIIKYAYSFVLIVLLCAIFSHGPDGGWILGFIISCYFGMMLAAALWLINTKGWSKYLLSVIIPLITLAAGLSFTKQIPELKTEWLTYGLDILILLFIYVGLIEIVNFISRKK